MLSGANRVMVLYPELQRAYDFYNQSLFQGRLPPVMITVQRKSARTYGFVAAGRFVSADGTRTDELAMNPVHFLARDIEHTLATLVHEMTHVEQQHYGKPGRSGYHNKAWGELMKRVGLHPSNTGKPGGKVTGQQMTHYILPDGAFARETQRLMRSGYALSWGEYTEQEGVGEPDPDVPQGVPAKLKKTKAKVRYVCPRCLGKAWGKLGLKLICGECEVRLVQA